jgi:hypothetical protein
MALIPLNVSFETSQKAAFLICKEAGVTKKGTGEVLYSLEALQAWKDYFMELYGDLEGVTCHTNPDDPPDITLNFSNGGKLGVEHTRLEPHPYGWMNDLHNKLCPNCCITEPSILFRPENQADLLSEMLRPKDDWIDFRTENTEWVSYLNKLLVRKVKFDSEGILVIQDNTLFFGDRLTLIANAIHEFLSNHPEIRWRVILHSRSNPSEFISHLISFREIKKRKNKPLTRKKMQITKRCSGVDSDGTQTQAILRYLRADGIAPDGDSCYSITPRLINGEALSEEQQNQINALDEALTQEVACCNLILYRGACRSFVDIIEESGSYPSFVSTSTELSDALRFVNDHGEDGVLLRIHYPSGFPCIDISRMNVALLEHCEVLLPRDTRFEITECESLAGLTIEQQLMLEHSPAPAYYELTAIE